MPKSSILPRRGPSRAVTTLAIVLLFKAAAALAAGPVAASGAVADLPLLLSPLTRAELAEEAAQVRDLARAATAQLAQAKLRVRNATGADAQAAQEHLETVTAERRELFDRLTIVLDSWAEKGGDEDAIGEYRQYMSAIVTEGIKTTNAATITALALKWLASPDGGIALGLKAAGFIAALIVLLFVARTAARMAKRALERASGLSTLLKNFLRKFVYAATLIVGLLVVLSMLGVNMGPVFAVVGGASFIIAFAMQSTLSNFAAGLMIMVYKPFDVGHYVTLAGVSGTVKAVSLVSTTLHTPDNQMIVIPNGNAWGSIITNVTANETRRVDLVFGIAYTDDADKAQQIMEEIVGAHPQVLKDPAPVVRMHELAESSVNFVCRPWVSTSDYWAVYWDLTRQVKARFDKDGISIPFPQRDVHVYEHK